MLAALWAYDGWNNMPMAAGEVKDPGRNVPRALIGGMVVVMGFTALANLAYFYALPFADVLTSNSTTHGRRCRWRPRPPRPSSASSGGKLISIAFIVSALGALNGATLSGARVPFAMARDGCSSPVAPASSVPDARAGLRSADAGVLGQRAGDLRTPTIS